MTDSKRSEQNQTFLDTLFLDGGDAAYLEQMQARYVANPNSVDPSWRAYFASLGEDAANARKNADGPSWKRKDWPQEENGELTSALTSDWGPDDRALVEKIGDRQPTATPAEIQRATKDSLRALMLIRAYRIRGHIIADLDPLGLDVLPAHPDMEPEIYGFTDADMDLSLIHI